MNSHTLRTVSELFSEALTRYKEHRNSYLLLSLLGLPALLIPLYQGILGGMVLSFIFALFNFLVGIALALRVMHNNHPQVSISVALKNALPLFLPSLWVMFLLGLTVWGSFALFVVPGIFMMIVLSNAMWVLYAENKRGYAALARSWHYAQGRLWEVFKRELPLFLASFLVGLLVELIKKMLGAPGVVVGALLNVLVTPFYVLYAHALYVSLRESVHESTVEVDVASRKKILIAFQLLGILAIFAVPLILGILYTIFRA